MSHSDGIEEISPHFLNRLDRDFFDVPCLQLAKSLLGQVNNCLLYLYPIILIYWIIISFISFRF